MTSRAQALAALTAPGAPFEIVPATIEGRAWRVYRNAVPSLRDVLASTAQHGDRDFLVYDDDRCTFAEHLAVVGRLAGRLAGSWGVAKGDRVAIAMRNYPEWAVTFWATQALGAVAVPLNAWWTGPELEYALRDSGAKVLVVDGERLERLAPQRSTLALEALIAVRHRGALPDGVVDWAEAVTGPGSGLPEVVIEPDDPATILYTSGTTGAPKGALATHRNHCTNLMNTALAGALGQALAPTALSARPSAPPPLPASLQVFPFFHIGGLTGLYAATAFGAKLVLLYKWDTELALDLLVREKITATALVPTLLRQLLESPRLHEAGPEALAAISSGGAPVPPDLIRRIETEFDRRVSPSNGYGLTETTSAVVVNSGAEYFTHPDSIGRPVPVADVRIVAEDGSDCAPGAVGELWVRGPNVVQGYWRKPEATAAAFTDGWFHSGDLARWDDDGLLYVVDRLKDVVIRGGENVYSAEVEAVLIEHPAIEDVAVVGLPDPRLGEEVAAAVYLRPGGRATAAELQEFAAARLARFKVPSTVVFLTEPLPRTASGKVLKRDLRESLSAARRDG